jgi:CHAT domain
VNEQSLAAAQALLHYRRGDNPAPMPVRDLCRRLLDAMGNLAPLGSGAEPDPHLLATALELAAGQSPEVRILVRELAIAVGAPPPGTREGGGDSISVHIVGDGNVSQTGKYIFNYGPLFPPAKETAGRAKPRFTVLFAGASPDGETRLQIDREQRALELALSNSGLRDQIHLETRMAVRPVEFANALLKARPRVVHFAGHGGSKDGALRFEGDDGYAYLAPAEGLGALFEQMRGQTECVILNACYSRMNADAILGPVPFVVGMNGPLHDGSAITFSTGFYQALGEGRGVPEAYAWGIALMKLMRAEGEMPVLVSAASAADGSNRPN